MSLPHQVVMTLESDAPVVEFTPRSFGRYYLIDKIAVGGMAEVFKAVFLGLRGFEMQLVIKRILPHLSADEDFVEMFVKEAKICVELRHHNIVQIYEFSRFNEHYFIAMEHVVEHDVTLFLHRNHSESFWATLSRTRSNWREGKIALERWETEHRAV